MPRCCYIISGKFVFLRTGLISEEEILAIETASMEEDFTINFRDQTMGFVNEDAED